MVIFEALISNRHNSSCRRGYLVLNDHCNEYKTEVCLRDEDTTDKEINENSNTYLTIHTPTISVPTFKGYPLYILPKMRDDKEVCSLFKDLDYLLIGYPLDCSTLNNNSKVDYLKYEDIFSVKCSRCRQLKSLNLLKRPDSQLCNGGEILYQMFRQPLYDDISIWNSVNDLILRTNNGRVQINYRNVIASMEKFRPVLYTSPAEESITEISGKNTSFRAISLANDQLIKLLEYHLNLDYKAVCDCSHTPETHFDNCKYGETCKVESPVNSSSSSVCESIRPNIIANIQGAHFENYRIASSLGIWDLCKGAGKGLENVQFNKEQGTVELKEVLLSPSKKAMLYDKIIAGVTIGGLGYSESSFVRKKCINSVVKYLPEDKIRFLSLNLGSPIEILQAFWLGIDIVECPYIYKSSQSGIALVFNVDEFWSTENGIIYNNEDFENVRKFLLEEDFTSNNTDNLLFGGARYINLSDRKCEMDFSLVADDSPLPYSRAYLHHLINSREMLAFTSLFLHNYWKYQKLLQSIRRAIEFGLYEQFVTWFITTQTEKYIHPTKLPQLPTETYTVDDAKEVILNHNHKVGC
ncbi:queuine tRNA-ribosyltransferase family protein [Cryptosporidium andersoni]|uniref:Queuine tRNA-ribosyltransferase family protein n=1 Tax=Cryptosporidium andersoni TaxID=117008 RepID=A0A1J4MSN1_9CRYT|nr:queuine tRNA-ribosyltransferase family protein [Cryptosporidium andersoni]